MREHGWVEWVPVGEVGDVRMGKQLSPASRASGEQLPYLRVANVLDGRIDYSDVKTMGFSAREQELYELRRGDILLNEGQESLSMVGRSALYDGPPNSCFFQNTLIRFRCTSRVLPKYARFVFAWWHKTGIFARTAEKTSISHLGSKRFARLSFPLLPLDEQRRIAEVLEAAEQRERAVERSIDKLRSTKEGLREDLLSDDSGEWVEEPLGERLASIDSGRSPDLSEFPAADGEWGVVKVSAIHSSGFRPWENKVVHDPALVDKRYEIHDGDVLLSRANGSSELVGSACIATPTSAHLMLSDKILRLVVDPGVAVAEFVNICLSSFFLRRQITNAASGGSGMRNISQRAVERLVLRWPPLDDQRRIVEEIGAFDARIEAEQRELTKVRSLKEGLREDLLSGRVRVSHTD